MEKIVEYKIEKGVPLPPKGAKYGTGLVGELRRMEVSDSMFLAIESRKVAMASLCKVKTGAKFTTRSRTENGVLGVRIWRIA